MFKISVTSTRLLGPSVSRRRSFFCCPRPATSQTSPGLPHRRCLDRHWEGGWVLAESPRPYTRPASSQIGEEKTPDLKWKKTQVSPILSKSRVLAPCHFRLLPNLPSSLACEERFGPSARGSRPPCQCSHRDTSVILVVVAQAPYGRVYGSSTLPLLPPASSDPQVPACHVPNESRTATPPLPRSPTKKKALASTQADSEAKRTPYETQSSISA